MDNRFVPVDHYENFPVASLLCPPRLRPAIESIYVFARTADDIADEGEAPAAQRLESLAAYRIDLAAIASGRTLSGRWPLVFIPLREAVERHRLPIDQLAALLNAFTQDVTTTRYADRAALLDYCRRSANPIGRLLLHLYGITAPEALVRSDAICTALQLANFWQDLRRDASRDRLYVPEADYRRCGVDPSDLLAGRDSPAVRTMVLELARWSAELMHLGTPLVHTIPGRAGWELRFVVQGGLRIIERIGRSGGATLTRRPRLGALDFVPIAWRALRMRPSTHDAARPQHVA